MGIKSSGVPAPGKPVNFEGVKEEWNEYLLEDGTRLRVKLVVTKILRTNQIDPEGNPVYVITSQNVVGVYRPSDK